MLPWTAFNGVSTEKRGFVELVGSLRDFDDLGAIGVGICLVAVTLVYNSSHYSGVDAGLAVAFVHISKLFISCRRGLS